MVKFIFHTKYYTVPVLFQEMYFLVFNPSYLFIPNQSHGSIQQLSEKIKDRISRYLDLLIFEWLWKDQS